MAINEAKEKVKNVLNKIFNSILFPVIICILIFFKTILFYNNTIAINEKLNMETVLGTMYFTIRRFIWCRFKIL